MTIPNPCYSQLIAGGQTNDTVGSSEDDPAIFAIFAILSHSLAFYSGNDDEKDTVGQERNLGPMRVPPQLNFGWWAFVKLLSFVASRLSGFGGLKSGRFELPTEDLKNIIHLQFPALRV